MSLASKLKDLLLVVLLAAIPVVLYFNSYTPRTVYSKTPGLTQVALKPAFPHLKFERPVDFQDPGDGYFYVAEQPGVLTRFKKNPLATEKEMVLDLRPGIFFDQGETGFLGLAFDPDFKSNRYFYVNYTAPDPLHTVVSRFKLTKNGAAKIEDEFLILKFDQPYSNHNGGQIAFGPDGFLYIATGDGGAGGDPHGNGQNLQTLLGKMLRIDVRNGSAKKPYDIPRDNPFASSPKLGRPEIYAWGMRNPWRFSFDSQGRLWAGDVGQNAFEEIHLIEKGKNYGWNIMEGRHCFKPEKDCPKAGLELPVYEYPRRIGSCVIGGFVYEGQTIPELRGQYIFADFVSRTAFVLKDTGNGHWAGQPLLEAPGQITSFGIDTEKEIYALDIFGRIYKFSKR